VNDRAANLNELLPGAGVDLLLVTNLFNVRYLTGYTGSNGLALVGEDTRTFVSDFRYAEQSAEEVDPSFERRIVPPATDLLELVNESLPGGADLRLGFEADNLSVQRFERLRELVDERVGLAACAGLVESLRAVKEAAEIASIKAATTIADASFERLLREGLVGRTERELALALEHDMRERGAERASFDSIVAGGAHGALPHAQPREVEIRAGDLVVIDWGAELDGYCSDCTRTVAAGDPGDEAREIYELVLEAQLAAVDAIRAGRSTREVDGAARDVISARGYGEQFGHGLGHGVGLEVHEGPTLRQRSEGELQAGNVVTVEPGVYLPGRFGVRIEDLVLVTEDGPEIITSVPKRLMVVD
jgi:Xaa-Pro aminopeptidase